MSERRCPKCGGLVGADAEWCTQCFARLDQGKATSEPEQAPVEESAPAPPAPGDGPGVPAEQPKPPQAVQSKLEGAPVRVSGDTFVWDCPQCDTENPIEARVCTACGTRFGQMFDEPEVHDVDPGRAAMFSLFFPGAGHFVAGKRSEGFARGIIFAFAIVMGIASIGPVRADSGGTYLLLMVVSLAAAAGLYVTSTADAGRAARGEEQILSMRVLLYSAVGLIFFAIVMLTFAATQARGG